MNMYAFVILLKFYDIWYAYKIKEQERGVGGGLGVSERASGVLRAVQTLQLVCIKAK